MNNNHKKGVLVGIMASLVLVLIFGVTFAIWNYSRVGENQVLVAGDIFMKYTETNELAITNAMPSEGPGEKYFSFTIEGKNNYSKPIYYEIVLNYGDDQSSTGRTERIKDNLLMFRLVETKDGVDKTVLDNATYADLKNKKIWVNNIPANQNKKVTINYKLYMWISGKTIIGNTEDAVYDIDTWNKVYASIKVSVNGDFKEKEVDKNGVNIIKNTLGNKGGVIGINNANKKVIAVSDDIREYRYSGLDVNNYVYFNCTDGLEQNSDNCETWRIVGIFKDESEAEHLKIVRNEVLSGIFPETFESNDTTYNIKYTSNDYQAHWNNKVSGTNNNDWATAGLQYWLNTGNDKESKKTSDGYMSYLSKNAKDMIEETKYYLGTITTKNIDSYIKIVDTPKEAYENERAVSECSEGKGASSNTGTYLTFSDTPNCRVWANNQAIWEGEIALMYPSDYGFSVSSDNWDMQLTNFEPIKSTSWMNSMPSYGNWLLSPSSYHSARGTYWPTTGNIDSGHVTDHTAVRPCLYLKSNVKITNGNGSIEEPYFLEI